MNRKAICNTGPIVALSMIDRIDILRHLFEFIAVPETVHKEILEGGATNAGLANYRKVKWIKVITLSNPVDPLLRTSLDAGEAAVIGLARELSLTLSWLMNAKPERLHVLFTGSTLSVRPEFWPNR